MHAGIARGGRCASARRPFDEPRSGFGRRSRATPPLSGGSAGIRWGSRSHWHAARWFEQRADIASAGGSSPSVPTSGGSCGLQPVGYRFVTVPPAPIHLQGSPRQLNRCAGGDCAGRVTMLRRQTSLDELRRDFGLRPGVTRPLRKECKVWMNDGSQSAGYRLQHTTRRRLFYLSAIQRQSTSALGRSVWVIADYEPPARASLSRAFVDPVGRAG